MNGKKAKRTDRQVELPECERYFAVIEIKSRVVIYLGCDDYKAARAWNPGTTIGYSHLSLDRALAAAITHADLLCPTDKKVEPARKLK